MVKIQMDLSEDEDKTVEIFKLANNLRTKQEAIKKMIRHFNVEINPKNIDKKDYFEA